MKEEVRSKTKKKIATETEETLIERGRQEARESFRKLVERTIQGVRFKVPKYTYSFSCVITNDENYNENCVNNYD